MIKKRLLKNKPAYSLLITVLIVTMVAVSIIVGVLLSGIGAAKISNENYYMQTSNFMAKLCAERALMEIRLNSNYTGTQNVDLGDGRTCDWEVINTGGAGREVRAAGQYQDFISRQRVTISAIFPAINIATWERVSTF